MVSKMSLIPWAIRDLVVEATTNYNDGFTQKHCYDRLEATRDYINGILKKSPFKKDEKEMG